MKKLLILILLFYSGILFGQQEIKDTTPLTKTEFFEAVKKDFSLLLGNTEDNINNNITTSFNNKESTVTGKFLISPKILNPKNKFRSLISSEITFGESNNILDLGNSKMPLVELSLTHNWIISKVWSYTQASNYEPAKPKKIIIAKDSTLQIERDSLYYTDTELKKKHFWSHKQYFWLTTKIDYKNAKYQIYDIKRPFNDQLYKENYSNFSGTFGLNIFGKWLKDNSYWEKYIRPTFAYVNISYTYLEDNNINSLNKVDVTDYKTTTDSLDTRQISTTRTAYRGEYKKMKKHNISSEVLVGIHKNVSLNLFSNIQITDSTKPVYSFGTGLYFLVKDKENKTKVNLGIFIKKEDGNDSYIGFKTSLPINIK